MTPALGSLALAISQSFLLSIAVKATLCLAVGLALVGLLPRTRASVRSAVLAATFGSVLLLPLVTVVAPAVSVPVSAFDAPGHLAAPIAERREAADPYRPSTAPLQLPSGTANFLVVGWAIGMVFCAVPLAIAIWSLATLRRSAIPWPTATARVQQMAADRGLRRRVQVLRHEATPSPIAFGMTHPVVMLPADSPSWDDAELRRALVHELEHVRRHDWIVQVVARAVLAIYWCHPLAWVAWRRLGLESERACDDAVVAETDAAPYAQQLVQLASRLSADSTPLVVGMAHRSDLSTRVAALLDAGQARGRAGTAVALAAIGAAIFVVALVSPLRATSTVPTQSVDRGNRTATNEPGRRQRAIDVALYEAASEGDRSAVAELLDAGADVNARLQGDGSALIGAARRGDLEIARLLIERGADPNLAVSGDGSALIAAASGGHAGMATYLLDRGALVDLVVEGDENALIQASGGGHLAVVRALVGRGADVHARVLASTYPSGSEWRTPLGMARRGGHAAVVAFLIASGAHE